MPNEKPSVSATACKQFDLHCWHRLSTVQMGDSEQQHDVCCHCGLENVKTIKYDQKTWSAGKVQHGPFYQPKAYL